jgi:hypothetical protein
MSRTTLDIDKPVLDEVKQLQQREGKSLGQVVSRLLAEALALPENKDTSPAALQWTAKPMGSRIDLADKEALFAALDEEHKR